MIRFTPRALQRLVEITSKTNKYLRLGVVSGGCAGIEYEWTSISEKSFECATSKKFAEYVDLCNGFGIEICEKSVIFIVGTQVDWKEDVIGSSFVYSNPNALSTCGCATSFSTAVSE